MRREAIVEIGILLPITRRLLLPMANIAIIGAQWGDEGKGKVVDLFTQNADIIVRFQGGNNAGHTSRRQREKNRSSPGSVRRSASE